MTCQHQIKSESVTEGFGRLTTMRSTGVCSKCGEKLCENTLWHATLCGEIIVRCTLSHGHSEPCRNVWLSGLPVEVR